MLSVLEEELEEAIKDKDAKEINKRFSLFEDELIGEKHATVSRKMLEREISLMNPETRDTCVMILTNHQRNNGGDFKKTIALLKKHS